MPTKELLNAIHDVIRWVGHICLVPVIMLLKSLQAGINYAVDELSKV